MHLIDKKEILARFEIDGGFHYANWEQIWDEIAGRIAPRDQEEAWNEACRLWLMTIRDDLGGRYEVTESEDSFLLSDGGPEERKGWQRYVDRCIGTIRKTIGETAWQNGFGKRGVIVFGEQADYYQYQAHYCPDAEQASSGGVSIGQGFSHIALPRTTEQGVCDVIVHELAHDSMAHLALPNWLDEGIAQALERRLGEQHRDVLVDEELAERHFHFWSESKIQEFWAGTAFFKPGDSNELSYSLAEILFGILLQDHARGGLKNFLEQANRVDAGQDAAMSALGLDLGRLAGTFLGAGQWSPEKPAIQEHWRKNGWGEAGDNEETGPGPSAVRA